VLKPFTGASDLSLLVLILPTRFMIVAAEEESSEDQSIFTSALNYSGRGLGAHLILNYGLINCNAELS